MAQLAQLAIRLLLNNLLYLLESVPENWKNAFGWLVGLRY